MRRNINQQPLKAVWGTMPQHPYRILRILFRSPQDLEPPAIDQSMEVYCILTYLDISWLFWKASWYNEGPSEASQMHWKTAMGPRLSNALLSSAFYLDSHKASQSKEILKHQSQLCHLSGCCNTILPQECKVLNVLTQQNMPHYIVNEWQGLRAKVTTLFLSGTSPSCWPTCRGQGMGHILQQQNTKDICSVRLNVSVRTCFVVLWI